MVRFYSLWRRVSMVGICLLFSACAGKLERRAPERLFFAMQIEDGGKVIARPRLLGEAGRLVTMKIVEPDRPEQTRLALELFPERKDHTYRVQIKMALPDRAERPCGELALSHGEERLLRLDNSVRPLTVRLLLMRTSSPEFDTFMKLSKSHLKNLFSSLGSTSQPSITSNLSFRTHRSGISEMASGYKT